MHDEVAPTNLKIDVVSKLHRMCAVKLLCLQNLVHCRLHLQVPAVYEAVEGALNELLERNPV